MKRRIRNVPPSWAAATLTLEAPEDGLGQGVTHSITSPAGLRDVVFPSDELMLATRKLELGSIENKLDWRKAVVGIEKDGEVWKTNVDFDYGDTAAE